MFDKLKAVAGLAGLAKDMPRIKAKLQHVRQELGDRSVTSTAMGGAVSVEVSGRLEVIKIEFDPRLFASMADATQGASRQYFAGLVAQATNEALKQAQAMAAQEMSRAAEELGLPLPPGGLSGLIDA